MDIQEIIKLYNEGKSLSFIANKYNTCGVKIKSILEKEGIKIRTRAEQNRITNQEGKKLIITILIILTLIERLGY